MDHERSDVAFDSAGLRCAAWLYRPIAAAVQGSVASTPCVVMAHGWTGVREQRLDAYAERFAAAGLAVLVFDYRHFGESEGEPRELMSIRRQLEDWAAAIAYARALPGIDAERIALWGTSFSGGHVLAMAQRDHRVAAVVAQTPFIDGAKLLAFIGPRRALMLTREGLRDGLRALMRRPPHMIDAVGPPGSVAAMTSPDAEPGFRALDPEASTWRNRGTARVLLFVGNYRPGTKVGRISCPVLYCVADDDAVTPAKPALDAAERTPRAEVKRYPIGHFDIYVGAGFERAIADQVEFFVRTLLGQAALAREADVVSEPDGRAAGAMP
jgi:dienelactone hydrolase